MKKIKNLTSIEDSALKEFVRKTNGFCKNKEFLAEITEPVILF